jgi:hypothetical protein
MDGLLVGFHGLNNVFALYKESFEGVVRVYSKSVGRAVIVLMQKDFESGQVCE